MSQKMQKYYSNVSTAAVIVTLGLFFANYLCGPVESAENTVDRGLCTCRNSTAGEIGYVNCNCINHELIEIPSDLPTRLHELIIIKASIVNLRKDSFDNYKQSLITLALRELKDLISIENGIFDGMHQLRTIHIHYAPKLKELSSSLFHVHLPNLQILGIVQTGIKKPPYLNLLKTKNHLSTVDLESNQIEKLYPEELKISMGQLQLNYNFITEVGPKVFNEAQIASVNLRGNRKLQKLDAQAFVGIKSLRTLDLSDTSIQSLPTVGLEELEVLKVENTYTMTIFPSIYNFQNIKEARLTYPYHCCAFHFPKTHNPKGYENHEKLRQKMAHECKNKPSYYTDVSTEKNMHSTTENFFSEEMFHTSNVTVETKGVVFACGNLSKNYLEVKCYPAPDAFNPCEDLMGNWTLRVAVWIVAVAALLGNMAVLFVLLSSRFRLTVPKFLMCNLATADFCMGLYLLLIALMDARSIGYYFNHAIFWQRGIGCQIAGFLTVFSCMLSVFTLMIITGERWYTITYAIHLNRRLKLGASVNIMAIGWLFSVVMGALPLMGTSGYSKTSICLPMENTTFTDKLYLFSLLIFNGVAFIVICACYAKMYVSIRGGREAVAPVARSDMTVAKRMALLVFTDFACWAPVAFFGLTALAGYPLIDVPKTKILLVFFYPLNSCANPYLYALLTQQYRRDLFVLLSRFGLCSRRADEYKGTGPVPCGRRKTYCNDPRHTRGGGGGVGGGGGSGGAGSSSVGDTGQGNGSHHHHRGSVMTTVTSVDSVITCRPGSLTPLQELNNDYATTAAITAADPSLTQHGHHTSLPSLTPHHLELLPLQHPSFAMQSTATTEA
ncbi:GPCR, rhodopsin-like, 7TM,Leucine-rich repeat,Leucine-rich repeat domain, L domain-like,G protein- [Cinara cedri]|uniref:GPCR, rhodopsin-like, 7TM,Leucine-rich repeat,Leucine-rich repeat domain, L domain-like,G protein n=1 Tax=Cinara cedri TaxID=506608 RepID=A0A5E4MXJ0_9HEMI|nr:GPCR, rhodopsin-like, 7TM,Leucine-rich repeat,Leucine-rich repeat domain, L domain-like,G protein- [Cinara cedri]